MPNYLGGVWELSLATAGNNAIAACATPEAEAAVVGIPAMLDRAIGDNCTGEEISVPGAGIVGLITSWVDLASRAQWAAVDGVIGCQGNGGALHGIELKIWGCGLVPGKPGVISPTAPSLLLLG